MGAARVLLASRSRDKLREVQDLFAAARAPQVLSLEDVGIPETPEEAGVEVFESFRENALAKARFFARLVPDLPVLADDSGIEIDALGGQPGVRSRRFAARPGLQGTALDHANNLLVLERLRGTPDTARTARYVCAAVWLEHGRARTALGTCRGRILEAPIGAGGFGYDPLFWVPEAGASFGEIPLDQKHRFSHRARAFRALLAG